MPDSNSDAVCTAIKSYIRERFPAAEKIDLADDLSLLDSGIIDSMGILDLVTFIEDEYGILVNDDELVRENFDSVMALNNFVAEKR